MLTRAVRRFVLWPRKNLGLCPVHGIDSLETTPNCSWSIMGICGVIRGAKRYTTVSDGIAVRLPDLVNRQYEAVRPKRLLLADITYAST